MKNLDCSRPALGQRRWRDALLSWIAFVITTFTWLGSTTHLSGGPTLWWVAWFASLSFLCSLLGCWAGLGHNHFRWLATAVGAPAFGYIAGVFSGNSSKEFFVYCISLAGMVAALTTGLRIWKGRLTRPSTLSVQDDALQFGIKHILIWTAAAALMISLVRLTSSLPATGTSWGPFALACWMAATIVVVVWALLGTRVSSRKAITFLILIAGLTFSVGVYGPAHPRRFISAAILLTGLMFSLACLMLRMQGVRFVKSVHQ